MQFEQFEDGERRRPAAQSIDTGMGLERIGALLQGKHDNYDTDLMRSLIEASAKRPGDPDGPKNVHPPGDRRSFALASFLIADGVLPSNEGRGYVCAGSCAAPCGMRIFWACRIR
jgi:alanyl-tRNA synthetase